MGVVEADGVRVARHEEHAAVRQQHATFVLVLTTAHIRALDERVVLRVVEADGVRVTRHDEVVGASTSAAAQSKSVETKNEDVISKGCVKVAVRCAIW